jgi:hypothetical protein
MDQGSFDRLAAAIGSASSRRAAIAVALGAALGAASAAARSRRPGAAGPCGDGSRADNRCTKNSDCCTNLCNTAVGKTNKDRDGRCRCVRRNGTCEEDRNCCHRRKQGMVCLSGVCTDPCVNLGAACATDADCCDSGAGGVACVAGVCANACTPLGGTCAAAGPDATCCTGECGCQWTQFGRDCIGQCCIPAGQAGCISDADCCWSADVSCNTGTGTCELQPVCMAPWTGSRARAIPGGATR